MRWISGVLALAGVGVLISDALGEGGFRLTALGEWWFWIHSGSLQVLQPAIERHVSVALWDLMVQPLLESPMAVVLLVLAAALFGISRLFRRKR